MVNHWIVFKKYKAIKSFGVIKFLKHYVKRCYFLFFKKRFQACGSIYLESPYFIVGHSNIRIGKNFEARKGLRLEAITNYCGQIFNPIIQFGDNVSVNDDVHIGCTNKVIIGNNVLMASKIYISDHNHGYYDERNLSKHESPDIPPLLRKLSNELQVTIEDNVWIGELVSVLPGSYIGRGSVIGANSVVIGDIPPYTIAVGAPAKIIKRYDFNQEKWVSVSKFSQS